MCNREEQNKYDQIKWNDIPHMHVSPDMGYFSSWQLQHVFGMVDKDNSFSVLERDIGRDSLVANDGEKEYCFHFCCRIVLKVKRFVV